ncbi:MAG: glycosyltransferase family 4 protein [Thermoanaerobaculales bacterium]|jgi:glycosyltransferase involved in cell wall biosynthesis|nr:glycosyltransferase family 4 protein [Thermoanaerobaculales bacterium]
MKIAAVSHLASPATPTGAEKSLASLVEHLARRGHESGIIAPGTWCLSNAMRGAGVEVAEIPSRPCWLVQWGRQPLVTQVMRYLRWRAPDLGVRRMMVWLDRFWPEVVLVNCLPQLKGAAAARALGLPVVWHVREIVPPGSRRRFFARRLARDARRIVAVSEAVAAWIRDEGLGDRVEVVHNGVAVPEGSRAGSAVRAELGLPADDVLAGFLGGAAEHKGVGRFVDAAERAMERSSRLHAVIAVYGPESDVAALRSRVAGSPHSGRFSLLPPVNDVFDLLSALDIVAFSSIWPDSLPRVIMEAMAAARPVVAFCTGGVAEMVDDGATGYVVDPGDTAALGDRLVRLAADGELRRRMGSSGRRRAQEEFSVARHVDRMEKILVDAAGAT